MDSNLRLYELLFITNPEYDDEKAQSVIARYQEVVESGGGSLKSAEKWGKRRLAYDIEEKREGLYILAYFESGPSVPKEIDRLMKIDQDIMRHVIVRKDGAPKAPKRLAKPPKPRTDDRYPQKEEGRLAAARSSGAPEAQAPEGEALPKEE